MYIPSLAFWFLAIALILHTLEEGWLPDLQKPENHWRSVVFNRVLFLDNLAIFIFAIALGAIGWKFPIISGILPAIGLTHPLFDHVGLSWKYHIPRPGIWTGLLLMMPLSLWIYALGMMGQRFEPYEIGISGVIGVGISGWLFWMVDRELRP